MRGSSSHIRAYSKRTVALACVSLTVACGGAEDAAWAPLDIGDGKIHIAPAPKMIAVGTSRPLSVASDAPNTRSQEALTLAQPNRPPPAVLRGFDSASVQPGRFWGGEVTVFVATSTPPSVNLRLREANSMEVGGQVVRAQALPQAVLLGDGSTAYALRFRLPKGVHGGPASLVIDGQPSANNLNLQVVLPVAFNGITSVAVRGSALFVADTDAVYEVNWRDDVPTKTVRVAGRYFISTATEAGTLLLVSALAGKPNILELPVLGPAGPSVFASTASLSASMRAVGIAADASGASVYVADAVGRNILRISRGAVAGSIQALLPALATETFYEPAGLNVFESTLGYLTRGVAPDTTNSRSISTSGTNLQLEATFQGIYYGRCTDRPLTINNPGAIYSFVDGNVGPTLVFNPTTGTVAIAQATASRQRIELYEYQVVRPGGPRAQRVLTSNQPKLGQQFPYFEDAQTADAVISVPVIGYADTTLHYKLFDAPDTAPYADAGVVPFSFRNDNRFAAGRDAGFGLGPTGAPCLSLRLDGNGEGTLQLRVPSQQSGDNYRIAASVTTWGADCELAPAIVGVSAPVIAWKRVFVEKDIMFRKGGFLSRNSAPGNRNLSLWKTPLMDGGFVRTDGIAVGNRIAVFDTGSPLEGLHDEVCVTTLNTQAFSPDSGVSDSVNIGFNACAGVDGGTGGTASLTRAYAASRLAVFPGEGKSFDFGFGRSAAVGVIGASGATPADFFDFDFDRLHEAYNDAYVDFVLVDTRSSAVPSLSRQWLQERARFALQPNGKLDLTASGKLGLNQFSRAWFGGFVPTSAQQPAVPRKSNYLHVTGAGENPNVFGLAAQGQAWAQIYAGAIESAFSSGGADAVRAEKHWVLAHELAHHFRLNSASTTPLHDARPAWCNSTKCGATPGSVTDGGIPCLMQATTPSQVLETKFCIEDLLLGDPSSPPDSNGRKPFSLRGAEEPL
jgi:hypothetical protein